MHSLAHQLHGLVSFFFLSFSPSAPTPFPSFHLVLKMQILSYLLHVLFEFSVAALTNVHKLGGLTPQKCILSEFWGGRSLKSVSLGGNRGVSRAEVP